MARIESRLVTQLQRSEEFRSSTEVSVGDLRDSIAHQATDLARTMEHLASVCAVLVERVEADERERRALVEAIARIGAPSTTLIDEEPTDTHARIIGGTITAGEIPGATGFSPG